MAASVEEVAGCGAVSEAAEGIEAGAYTRPLFSSS